MSTRQTVKRSTGKQKEDGMSRFAGLKQQRTANSPKAPEPPQPTAASDRAKKPREGKKLVGGYFSQELSRGINVLAAEQGTSVQALLGEAIDDLMRKHGKHPFGER